MTVHTPYAPTTTPTGTGPQQRPGQRRPLVIGLIVTFGVLAAVLVAGRVVVTRTTTTPATTPAAATGELNAKALADRYSTAAMAPSIRDDTGAWLHRTSVSTPTGVQSGYSDPAAVARHFSSTGPELNAKALADRYSTTGMTSGTHELNAKALEDRYSTTTPVPRPPGIQLRRSSRIVEPSPSVQVPPQLVP